MKKTFTEAEVRDMLESARVEMREHCAESVRRSPILADLLSTPLALEVVADVVEGCLCDGHFPPPLKRHA